MAGMLPDFQNNQMQVLGRDTIAQDQRDLATIEFGLGFKKMILAFIVAIADALIFAMYLYQMLGAWHQWFEALHLFLQILVLLVGFIPFCIAGWKAFALYVDGHRNDAIEKEIIAERRMKLKAELAAVYSEVHVKDAQARKHDAEAAILYAEATNKRIGAGIPSVIQYDANGNPPIVFDARNWEFHQFALGQYKPDVPHSYNSRVEMVKDPTGLIAAPGAGENTRQPEAIPAIIRYADIADDIPDDMSLLGIHPSDGSLELTDWEKLKALWLVGSSSTGKSNTIYGKAMEAANKGAKLLVIDQHAEKEDSLTRKLQPLVKSFLRSVAIKDDEVLKTLADFKAEFERRVAGGSCAQKIVLIADEMNRMVRNEQLKKALQDIVAICGEESRGFGMYGWFISQKAVHLKWLRDSAITVIVHRVTRFEEALLACNEDRVAAKRLLEFPVGRSYIYGVDFEVPLELQQPLYEAKVIDVSVEEISPSQNRTESPSSEGAFSPSGKRPELRIVEGASEGDTKGDEHISLTEHEKNIGEMFFVQGLNPNAIVKELYPDRRGGDAYQKASIEVANAIRKYGKYMDIMRGA